MALNFQHSFLQKYQNTFRSLIRKQLIHQNDVEDILQEVNIKFIKYVPETAVNDGIMMEWMKTVIRNTSISFKRKRSRGPQIVISLDEKSSGADGNLITNEHSLTPITEMSFLALNLESEFKDAPQFVKNALQKLIRNAHDPVSFPIPRATKSRNRKIVLQYLGVKTYA